LLDIDENPENFDKFIFNQSNKVLDNLNKHLIGKGSTKGVSIDDLNRYINTGGQIFSDFPIWDKNRVTSTIGRVINKLYPGEFPNAGKSNSIESFVDAIKSERTKELGVFKLVEGDELIKYYNENTYDPRYGGSPLFQSCMRYSFCAKYFDFYVKNDVKLLILLSDEDDSKILGRAIVWPKVGVDDGEIEHNRTYMDRIYYCKSADIQKFKNYATKNGWLYKTEQNRLPDGLIMDPLTQTPLRLTLRIDDIVQTSAYPYLDTIKYLTSNNELSNKFTNRCYTLESTKGGYIKNDVAYIYNEHNDEIELLEEDDDHEGEVWSEIENEWLDENYATYSSYLDEWVSNSYAEDNWTYCELENDYIPNEDVIEIHDRDEFVSLRFARRNCTFSDIAQVWCDRRYIVNSQKQGPIPDINAVIVYLNIDKTEKDWRYDNNDYITIVDDYGDKEYYDNDLKDQLKEKGEN
jgi:hypothetical protein